jgi:nitric oxide reductase subunit B
LVIAWIFGSATGGIYYYLPHITNSKMYGYFGGREYLEYPPIIAIPVLISWILFMVNFLKTLYGKLNQWPVYIWMWATGIIFFIFTLIESYLWMIPFFRDNIIRDITVQWKAMGAMVGSWNMLVYGTAFYLMEKINGNDSVAKSHLTFFFYFLGLVNLMFNWGHHTYIVPAAHWIKTVSYIVSMTELLILGKIIWSWQKTLNEARKNYYIVPYRFLLAAEVWIFLNLILAIIISIPSINFYTHGTHITVAHAMGTTIGINSMILFASVFYILSAEDKNYISARVKKINLGYWITNISLFIFWASLLAAGIIKAVQTRPGNTIEFGSLMKKLSTAFDAFAVSGDVLFIGIMILALPAIKKLMQLKKINKLP